jgi:hypothetical protein
MGITTLLLLLLLWMLLLLWCGLLLPPLLLLLLLLMLHPLLLSLLPDEAVLVGAVPVVDCRATACSAAAAVASTFQSKASICRQQHGGQQGQKVRTKLCVVNCPTKTSGKRGETLLPYSRKQSPSHQGMTITVQISTQLPVAQKQGLSAICTSNTAPALVQS